MIDVLEALFDLELEEIKHADEAIKHVGYAADGFGLIVKQSANICCVTRHGLKICGKGCIKELQFTHNKNMLSPDGQKAILSYLLEKREAYKAGLYGNEQAELLPLDVVINGVRFRLELVKLT